MSNDNDLVDNPENFVKVFMYCVVRVEYVWLYLLSFSRLNAV